MKQVNGIAPRPRNINNNNKKYGNKHNKQFGSLILPKVNKPKDAAKENDNDAEDDLETSASGEDMESKKNEGLNICSF